MPLPRVESLTELGARSLGRTASPEVTRRAVELSRSEGAIARQLGFRRYSAGIEREMNALLDDSSRTRLSALRAASNCPSSIACDYRAHVLARWAAGLLAVGGVVSVVLSLMPDAFYLPSTWRDCFLQPLR